MKNIIKDNIIFRIFLYVILLIVILILAFFAYKEAKSVKTYKEINFDELVELVDSNENFILFIGSNTCSHCTLYKETLNIVISKYHVVVNYIDINDITNEQLAYIKARFAFSATPTTVFIRKGNEEVSERVEKKISGSIESDKLIELFKKYGYIKE